MSLRAAALGFGGEVQKRPRKDSLGAGEGNYIFTNPKDETLRSQRTLSQSDTATSQIAPYKLLG